MEEALRSALLAAAGVSSLVGTRIDWGLNPQGAARPSIRLTTVSRVRDTTFAGMSGLSASRVQVDCFADSYGGAKAVSRAVVAKVDTLWPSLFQGVLVPGERDTVEDAEPNPINNSSVDLIVWHTGP